MDLVREGLDVLRPGEVLLKGLDVRGRLVLGGQQHHGDLDLGRLGGVDHGGVHGGGRLEGRVWAARQADDLAAPAGLRMCLAGT